MNPEPFTVTVVVVDPAVALEGETDVTVGAGFVCGGGVEVLLELPPPPPPQEDSRKADRNKTTETPNSFRRWQSVAKHITKGPHYRRRDESVKQSSWIFPPKKQEFSIIQRCEPGNWSNWRAEYPYFPYWSSC
jgi:hypothetical protein